MSLNIEYQREIEYFINNIPKRMYAPSGSFGFEAFFTYDRLTLEEALKHKRQPVKNGTPWGRKWEYGWFFGKITIPESCKGEKVVFSAKHFCIKKPTWSRAVEEPLNAGDV